MTYRKFAELALNTLYNGMPSDDASISLRHIAEMVAMEVAYHAKKNAFENSNAGETTFANDQFISVYNGLALSTDTATQEKYITMPATPAGLPNNQEIVSVTFEGCPDKQIIPMKAKDSFAQSFLPKPKGFSLYKVEDGKIVFKYLPKLFTGTVNLKMIGSIEGETLLDSNLNVPKDVESEILNKVVLLLRVEKQTPRDLINDSVPLPQ